MSTDHRAEAERLLSLAAAPTHQAEGFVRRAAVHAALADRCPDPDAHRVSVTTSGPHQVAPNTWTHTAPDAHQAEDGIELDSLRKRLTEALALDEDDSDDEIVHTIRMRLAGREELRIRGRVLAEEVNRLRAELAEARAALLSERAPRTELLAERLGLGDGASGADVLARIDYLRGIEAAAARPAPIRPEVVAVVEAAQEWAVWIHDGKGKPVDPTALYDAVRALPEDWRDGAAPAAVPAELGAVRGAEKLDAVTTPAQVQEHARNWFDPDRTLDDAEFAESYAGSVAFALDVLRGSLPAAVPAVLDEAGIDRATRVLGDCRALTRDVAARRVVRAYLGDTDTGSEAAR